MKQLVVGLDGSSDSRRALRWAAAVAERAKVPLSVVQAWSYPSLAVIPGWTELVAPAEMDDRTVDEIRAVVVDELGDVPPFVDVAALRGPAADAILRVAQPDAVLVLGGRGFGGFAGLLLGSVSRECIEYAPCPVVIARDDQSPVEGGVIMVGTDGSENSARALAWAGEFGGLTGAAVVAVYAWETSSSEVNPRLHQRLRAEAQATVDTWIADGAHSAASIQAEGEARKTLVELTARDVPRRVVPLSTFAFSDTRGRCDPAVLVEATAHASLARRRDRREGGAGEPEV
jgi:nucleotide-binding universal stress UspA family protein